jgi:hypothetical protein
VTCAVRAEHVWCSAADSVDVRKARFSLDGRSVYFDPRSPVPAGEFGRHFLAFFAVRAQQPLCDTTRSFTVRVRMQPADRWEADRREERMRWAAEGRLPVEDGKQAAAPSSADADGDDDGDGDRAGYGGGSRARLAHRWAREAAGNGHVHRLHNTTIGVVRPGTALLAISHARVNAEHDSGQVFGWNSIAGPKPVSALVDRQQTTATASAAAAAAAAAAAVSAVAVGADSKASAASVPASATTPSPATATTTAAAAASSPPPVHKGVTCDGCDQRPLTGERYQCNRCYDFDLCGACHATAADRHPPDHSFRRIDPVLGNGEAAVARPVTPPTTANGADGSDAGLNAFRFVENGACVTVLADLTTEELSFEVDGRRCPRSMVLRVPGLAQCYPFAASVTGAELTISPVVSTKQIALY